MRFFEAFLRGKMANFGVFDAEKQAEMRWTNL